MKHLIKMISFNQLYPDFNIFTVDTKIKLPEGVKAIIKEDGIYIEVEMDLECNNKQYSFANGAIEYVNKRKK